MCVLTTREFQVVPGCTFMKTEMVLHIASRNCESTRVESLRHPEEVTGPHQNPGLRPIQRARLPHDITF